MSRRRCSGQAGTLLICANRNDREYAAFGHVVADATTGFRGPLAGIASCARALHDAVAAHGAGRCAAAYPRDLAQRLHAAALAANADAAVARTTERAAAAVRAVSPPPGRRRGHRAGAGFAGLALAGRDRRGAGGFLRSCRSVRQSEYTGRLPRMGTPACEADAPAFPIGLGAGRGAVAHCAKLRRSMACRSESVALESALGRVLAGDVIAPFDVPGFVNSAMDGFAVRGCRFVSRRRNAIAPDRQRARRRRRRRRTLYPVPACASRPARRCRTAPIRS